MERAWDPDFQRSCACPISGMFQVGQGLEGIPELPPHPNHSIFPQFCVPTQILSPTLPEKSQGQKIIEERRTFPHLGSPLGEFASPLKPVGIHQWINGARRIFLLVFLQIQQRFLPCSRHDSAKSLPVTPSPLSRKFDQARTLAGRLWWSQVNYILLYKLRGQSVKSHFNQENKWRKEWNDPL